MIFWILALVAAIPALWITGDLVHSLLMRHGYARWERGIERDADGIRKGCREFTLGSGETAILLVHGFGDSPAIFQCMAPALAERGFTCRAMRLPYFATRLEDYRRTRGSLWREAVHSELLALRQGHSRVVLAAHSLGGAIAIDCLADHPEAADGMILLAPLLAVSNRRSPLLPADAWYKILDHTLLFTDRVRLLFAPGLRDEKAVALLVGDRFMPRVIYRELFALLQRNRQRANQLRIPLLMVLSRRDVIVDNRDSERFYQGYAGPRRLKYLEETSHAIPLDFGWEQVVEDMTRFIEELRTGATAERVAASE